MWEKMKILMSTVWEFLLPFFRQMMTESGQILANVAMNAVTAVAKGELSDSDKRTAAFNIIISQLEKQGIELGTSLINAAIEAAVQKLKSSQTV